jgi:hypothetical protein
MKHQSILFLFVCLLCLSSLRVVAQNYALKPGESVTVNFDRIRLLEKGVPPVAYRNVGAAATFTLDAGGTALTVNFQNLSLPDSAAALYALDLGLSKKLALQTQGQLIAGSFPPNAVWLGPTDNQSVTYGTGDFTIAARDAVLRQMTDFTDNLNALPASFLTAGQRAGFTLQFTFAEAADASPLRFRPVAYFVAPDGRSATPKRLRLATFGQGQANNAR